MTETRLDSSKIALVTEWIAEGKNSRLSGGKRRKTRRRKLFRSFSWEFDQSKQEEKKTESEEAMRFTFGWNMMMRTTDFRFSLCFVDVLFVSNAFITEPVTHLEGECEEKAIITGDRSPLMTKASYLIRGYTTSTPKFFLGVFRRVRIREMWIEVFIEDVNGTSTEVASFPSRNKAERRWEQSRDSSPSNLASRNLERRIITASQVLCFSWSWIMVNFFRMIVTMRSISRSLIGRIRDCSRKRLITCAEKSLQWFSYFFNSNL